MGGSYDTPSEFWGKLSQDKAYLFFLLVKTAQVREGTACNDYILGSLLICTIFPQGSGCWSWTAECQHWECRAVPAMICHAYFENQKGMGHKIRPPTHKVLLLFAIHHIHRCLEVIYQAILLRYAGMPISYHQNLSDAWYSSGAWTVLPFCPWCCVFLLAMEGWTLVWPTLLGCKMGFPNTWHHVIKYLDGKHSLCLLVQYISKPCSSCPFTHEVFALSKRAFRCVFLPRRPQFGDSKGQSSVWRCLGPGWGVWSADLLLSGNHQPD